MARLSHYDKILALLFVLSLPLVNPWVRGDGVGYYAFGRALLIQHNLDFKQDWLKANSTFRMGRTDAAGNLLSEEYTPTGHIDNHFSVGPAILWSPFLLAAHLSVLSFDALGGHVPQDGFAKPYIVSIALGTAFYGFLSLWLSFQLARKYLSEAICFPCDSRNLVREFAASLYVLQSVLVPLSLRVYRRAVRLVLGSHSRRPLLVRMDTAGRLRRRHDGRLSSQRDSSSLSCARIFVHVLERARPARSEILQPRIPEKCRVCTRAPRRFSTHSYRQENNLWQLISISATAKAGS